MNPLQPPTLSIVLGTLQRRAYLERAIESARGAVGNLTYEFVIVDGGSSDGTIEYLNAQPDVRPILQGERLGAVRAFMAGFGAARGEFVAALNDDLECVGTPLADAVKMLHADKKIGQVALPYLMPNEDHPHYELVNIPALGKVLYANFGVMRRALGNELNWWGLGEDGKPIYYTYGGDTELSVKVWFKGLRVVPLREYAPGQKLTPKDSYLIHYQVDDDTRVPNVEQGAFNARWRKPTKDQVTAADALRKAPQHIPEGTPPVPRHMQYAVLLRFNGKQDGRHPYTPPNSAFKYLVSATETLVWVDSKDVAWLLGLRQGKGMVFERV